MPLQAGSSSETISSNVAETLESPSFGWGKSKKKRRQMATAAAYNKAKTVSHVAMQKKK
jgi:hypothetical protein